MKIYTGYYAKLDLYKRNKLLPIAISRFPPKYYTGVSYTKLAPSVEILNKYKANIINDSKYTLMFNKYLKTLDIDFVLDEISCLSDDKDVVLLCYEKPNDFCHRHLVAKWITCNSDFVVNEFQPKGLLADMFINFKNNEGVRLCQLKSNTMVNGKK